MNRKAIYWVIIGACIITASAWYLPKHTWTSVTMDGASGGGFGAGRRGVGFSSATWKSMDGVMVDELVIAYSTPDEARKDFAEALKGDGTVVERDNGRIVKVFGNPQTREGAAEIIRLQDEKIRHIKAVSLRPALMFEKAWLKL